MSMPTDCIANSVVGHEGCTLRAAMLAANEFPAKTTVTILLPAGSILLLAPLPEVLGTLAIIGFTSGISLPAALGSLEDAPPTIEPEQRTLESKRGSTINGRRRHQLLRTAQGSQLFLKHLELVNGMAAKPSEEAAAQMNFFERARAPLGGALNALGDVAMDNVALRRNTAEYGGAAYFEGRTLKVLGSMIEFNVAERCGGAMFLAAGANARFEGCTIANNRDGCTVRTELPMTDRNSDLKEKVSSWLPWPWTTAAGSDAAGPVADAKAQHELAETKKTKVDVSGAIAQGQSLIPRYERLM
jgi:hypothetical protein